MNCDNVSERRAIGSHHNAKTGSDVWLTPPHVIDALGPFDLDPCAAPEPRPWPTAARHIARPDDGLAAEWSGRVWCNPPYSSPWKWLARLSAHGNGIALIFARTETRGFVSQVWRRADAILFIEGRLTFHRPTGQPGKANSGAPSCLVDYGPANIATLNRAVESGAIAGSLVSGWRSNADDEPHRQTLFDQLPG